MNNTTITITQSPTPQAIPSRFLASYPIQQQIENLVKEMLEAHLFTEEQREAIHKWKERIDQYCTLENINNVVEDIALALCYLRFHIILPNTKNPSFTNGDLFLLLDFKDHLEEILGYLFSTIQDVEQFIEHYEELEEEEGALKWQLENIESIFQEQIKQLYQAANLTNQKLVDAFNSIKQRVLELNKSRESSAGEINIQLDCLAAKINNISQEIIESSNQMQKKGAQMKEAYRSVEEMQTTVRNLFKGI